MANQSVSGWLSMAGSLRARNQELKAMKSEVSIRTTYADRDEVKEPTYDIREVDRKSAAITKALFRIDQAIKKSNATVELGIDVDFDELMEPLQ